ncbi:hypothetical protein GH885_05620 [Gracilibacillus thailandensis]|uniref:Uncharacterized protein n=2 Tax=Gracilibacillus thailandensis TaxID=563735 RepID=A0A6N7QWC2_9BACI|nr:hypothetical protein [Gracilibacillus thailandensis]
MDDYISVIFEARAFHADLIFDQYGFSDLLVLNPSWVAQEHKKRPDIPFYPFSKQAILKASDDAFVDRNKHYRSFVKFLTENYEIDHEDADEIVSECVVDIKLGLNPPDLVSRLSERFEFTSFAEVQPFMDQVMGLFNNTREWILKGHTSMELRPQEDKHLQPLPGEKAVNKPSVTSKKIGRNDSCPCGSGKKYKKCCGK